MLKRGDLPELAQLLGKDRTGFPHAYFAPRVITTFAVDDRCGVGTIFTGVAPSVHGFTGNEFFIREKKEFAASIPVSVSAASNALAVFTEGYANQFLRCANDLRNDAIPGARHRHLGGP